jgi:hypothetical protein
MWRAWNPYRGQSSKKLEHRPPTRFGEAVVYVYIKRSLWYPPRSTNLTFRGSCCGWAWPQQEYVDPFRCIDSISSLSIGHSFGIIPAPYSLASSAFPVPPKKQPLALGAVSTRFRVPQLQGQKQENKSCIYMLSRIAFRGGSLAGS